MSDENGVLVALTFPAPEGPRMHVSELAGADPWQLDRMLDTLLSPPFVML